MNVKAYTLSTCIYCMRFKQFMKAQGQEFEYVDVDLLAGDAREAVRRETESICSGCGYPIIVVGDMVIRGFDEPRLREVLGL
ncbi:MAG TPA: glutaredoxin family protein [Euryarchaeota archaeon]|nr:glutaredoxin family protein [Euryarchaeota archaeon]